MRHNTVKEKIARGEPSFGIWPIFPTADRIEFYGHLGYEFVVIDAEHLPISPDMCLDLVRASEVVGVIPIVRPPGHLSSTILPYLETGAMGVYVPHVQTADDARAIIQAVKYGPMGNRSAGSSNRPASYGLDQPPREYYTAANEETMVILLVEDVVGVSNLDEIVQVPGVDVVCIGPGDLSISMGHLDERADPEVMRAVRDAEARIAAAGKPFDCEPTNADEARAAIDRGALLVPFFEGNMIAPLFRNVLKNLA